MKTVGSDLDLEDAEICATLSSATQMLAGCGSVGTIPASGAVSMEVSASC
jgi:hypothetical protein